MNSRRTCREFAVQALYLCDALGDLSRETVDLFISHFISNGLCEDGESRGSLDVDPFFRELVEGIILNIESIDATLELASTNWSVARMANVERNILRVAVYEMLYRADIPSKVSINEAVEIAKEFASPEGPTFINGVLDQVRQQAEISKSQAPEKK